MAAISCRIAKIVQVQINPLGVVIHKNSATIAEMLTGSTELRVFEDTANAPNSTGYPTIENYIKAEANDGFKVSVINQTWIITYPG